MTVRLPVQRGGALILSILMLVAMTGLGLLAVTSSRMEVAVAGNFRLMKQAQYLAEAGLIAANVRIQGDPSTFVRLVKKPGGKALIKWRSRDFGSTGVFVTHDEGDQNNAKDRSMGYDARPIDFEVRVEGVRDLPSCPGYGTGSVCCLKVGLVSEGRVGDFDDDDVPLDDSGGAKRRVRAEYAVPYPCPK